MAVFYTPDVLLIDMIKRKSSGQQDRRQGLLFLKVVRYKRWIDAVIFIPIPPFPTVP